MLALALRAVEIRLHRQHLLRHGVDLAQPDAVGEGQLLCRLVPVLTLRVEGSGSNRRTSSRSKTLKSVSYTHLTLPTSDLV